MTALMSSIYHTVTAGIAQGRRKSVDSVQQMMAEGPFTAEQALQLGLVDELMYESELIPRIKQMPPKSIPNPVVEGYEDHTRELESTPREPPPKLTPEQVVAIGHVHDVVIPATTTIQRFDTYARQTLTKLNKRDDMRGKTGSPKVALIYGLGAVTSQAASFPTPGAFHSSTLAKTILNAANDPKVHIILFRIDSPGGSYVAADTVHAALLEAKAKGKRVVVSMAGMAASGGYFAAAPADVILANDATLTGSIGVFGGKPAIRRFMEQRLGITFDSLQVGGGATAGMYSVVDPWTTPQLRKINEQMDRIYADFVTKVAAGRGMTYEAAEALAKGRVWTGEQAKRNGLVDEVGGLWDAVQRCNAMIDPLGRQVAVVELTPRRKEVLQMLRDAVQQYGDAEKDDRPLFTGGSMEVGGGVRGVMEEMMKEGVGMLEAGMVRELQKAITGGVGGVGSLHVGDSMLGEMGLVDRHGKLLV